MNTLINLDSLLSAINTITLSLIGFALIHGLFVLILGYRERPETLCNIGIYFGFYFIKHFFTVSLTFGGLALFYNHKLFDIPATVYSVILCVVLADFLYYWKHRFEHEIRILWAAHSVHHSSQEFNLSTSLRLPWLTPFYSWMAYVPLAFLGFPPLMVISGTTIVLGYQFLIHTQVIGKCGVLEKILNTPSHHRVHHGSNAPYIDKNYGGIFIIWDKLFGSFAEEKIPVVYGITKPIHTSNPVRVNSIEVEHLVKDVIKTSKWKEACSVLFGRP